MLDGALLRGEIIMAATRVALVTGANRGIGREIVRQLARQGLLAVIGSRDPEKGLATAAALRTEGIEAPVVVLDVADEKSPVHAADEIKRLYGRCDVLVNNAGIIADGPGGFQASLLDTVLTDVRRTFETNVLGPLRLMQAVVPLMREQGYGRIVNLSSGAGQLTYMEMGFPAYRMSKSALNALTRIAATEFREANIKVNAVCPGWVKTDMGGPNATKSVEQGADTPVWLATLPDNGPTGGFFRDRKPIPW
jgi:NAD(P)-dependent dehydrogenase (short-subunit alcohol dehydrogenase family)